MATDPALVVHYPPHDWKLTQFDYTICRRCGTYRDFGGEKVRCNSVEGHADWCTPENRCCTDGGPVIPRTTDA